MITGNKFWRQRVNISVHRVMDGPDDLYQACIAYFDWVDDNPLKSEKIGFSEGDSVHADVYHPRAMTIWGLTSFIGITASTWYHWKETRHDLRYVMEWAEQIIKDQKFTNAAVGLMKEGIISRELGLAERQIMDYAAPQIIIAPPSDEPEPPEPPIHGE